MPGPGILLPTAMAFSGAALLGVGIFIGLNWDKIKEKVEMIAEVNGIHVNDYIDSQDYEGTDNEKHAHETYSETNYHDDSPEASQISTSTSHITPDHTGLRHRHPSRASFSSIDSDTSFYKFGPEPADEIASISEESYSDDYGDSCGVLSLESDESSLEETELHRYESSSPELI